ncbi:MAG: hypothetical protein M1825_005003 [Sarcosagium campestre]|nr:MAG: hypothetical protein M1825_005003 [Sarcosagium campestre]
MPLIQESHDSLPYIDTDITQQDRDSVGKEIKSELPADHGTTLHPLIPNLQPSRLSDLLEREIARKAADEPLTGGIDTSRYEALETPASPTDIDAWREALTRAYTSSTHLQTRLTNLSLLERFGKNAWLVGNSQLEDILRSLERELVAVKEQTDATNRERKRAQEDKRAEFDGLARDWRTRVGNIIEVEVAAEALRREILQKKREQS